MATSKILVLITGANSGVGLGLASELLKKPIYHVLLGSRSLEKGQKAAADLSSKNLPGTAEVLQIDVTNDESIVRAAAAVEKSHGKIDILVNNAGIAPSGGDLRKGMRDAFDTNATGTLMVTMAFAELLKKSTASPRIINVSSGAGSMERRQDRSSVIYNLQAWEYRSSKAALNMITVCQSVEYASAGIKVFAYCPGFTVSNLSENNKLEKGAKKVEDAAGPLVKVLEGKRDEDNGKFLHDSGIYGW